jgi:hypothetical protein
MKQAFEILKDRPMVKIRLTRDSVCAGDDCDAPHEENKEIHTFLDPSQFAKECSSGYLPLVSGIGHSWDCLLNKKKIARITFESIEPLVRYMEFGEENEVHFRYHSSTY